MATDKIFMMTFTCIQAENVQNMDSTWFYTTHHRIIEKHHGPEQVGKWREEIERLGHYILFETERRLPRLTKKDVMRVALMGFDKEVADAHMAAQAALKKKQEFLAIEYESDDDILDI